MLHAEPSESVLLALILCILCMYFLKWKLRSIRVPHYLIQNSYTLLSSKLRILIRTNLVLTTVTCLIAHTSLRVSSRENWYFNTGCSRHVIDEKSYFKESRAYANWLI